MCRLRNVLAVETGKRDVLHSTWTGRECLVVQRERRGVSIAPGKSTLLFGTIDPFGGLLERTRMSSRMNTSESRVARKGGRCLVARKGQWAVAV